MKIVEFYNKLLKAFKNRNKCFKNNPEIVIHHQDIVDFQLVFCDIDVNPNKELIKYMLSNLPEPDVLDPFGFSWFDYRNKNKPIARLYLPSYLGRKHKKIIKNYLIENGVNGYYFHDNILNFVTYPPSLDERMEYKLQSDKDFFSKHDVWS